MRPKSWNDYRDSALAFGYDDQEAGRYADERVRWETEQRAGEDGQPSLFAAEERESASGESR